jgi:hypothetical protein
MGACMREKMFPRACFACGEQMKPVGGGSHTLRCGKCEVTENGTISGMFKIDTAKGVEFGNDMIYFVDHGGNMCYPSPDSVGYIRESVPVSK